MIAWPQATPALLTTCHRACSKGANARKLQSVRGKDAYKANDLLADQLVTVDPRLDYEAIIQIAEIDDQDVLYLNFDNVALGGCHTDPYRARLSSLAWSLQQQDCHL